MNLPRSFTPQPFLKQFMAQSMVDCVWLNRVIHAFTSKKINSIIKKYENEIKYVFTRPWVPTRRQKQSRETRLIVQLLFSVLLLTPPSIYDHSGSQAGERAQYRINGACSHTYERPMDPMDSVSSWETWEVVILIKLDARLFRWENNKSHFAVVLFLFFDTVIRFDLVWFILIFLRMNPWLATISTRV